MTKHEVAAALDEIGTLLELKGDAGYRSQAYHNAARIVSDLEGDLKQLVDEGGLREIHGIGEALEQKITTLVTTGRLTYLDDLRKEVPAGMVQLLRVPGLGAKKVRTLHDVLGIDSIPALLAACERGQVAKVKGFGEKTQQRILDAVRYLGTVENRELLVHALQLGRPLAERLGRLPGVIRTELCGSLRRRRETVGNVNLVASGDDPRSVVDEFVKLPHVMEVTAREAARASVVAVGFLDGDKVVLNTDLRVVPDEQFPFAVVHFTGSAAHVAHLRQRARDRGLELTEFGLTEKRGPVPCRDEHDVYRALGLHWVPPEMREGTGEIELAERGEVPPLVEPSDIRGVFHNHTTASDGKATLAEMAAAARDLGYEYFGVADHSQSLTVANGLSPHRVRAQWAEVDTLNRKLSGIRVLKGTECDILSDGSLDFPDDLLAGFDYVVASVHSHFRLPEAEQTVRVCRALAHPAVTWLGHPTGRLLLRRDGYKLDIEKVLQTAAKHGKMIEINAQPDRLDLDWPHVKRAKELGIPLVINPDAHSPGELGYVPGGVNVARRGWLTAADVFNTRPLAAVLNELDRRKKAWAR
jgi:DNA polymerase (family 10)